MRRRFRVTLLSGVATMASLSPGVPLAAQGTVRVAVLLSQDSPPYLAVAQGFHAVLTQAGRPVTLETRVLDGDPAAATRMAERMRGNVDLVLALGSPAVRLSRRVLAGTPIVAGMVLKASEVTGPQMTGVYLEFPPDVEFQWLRKLMPAASRVGVLYNRAENGATIERAEAAARSAGLRLFAREVVSPSDIPGQLASLENDASVLWGLADSLTLTPETARPFLLFSLRNRIPFFGISEAWVRAGAIYALDRDYGDVGRQCGELAVRILKGETPVSIRPQPPRKVTYFVSQRAADVLGIQVSDEILKGARAVFD